MTFIFKAKNNVKQSKFAVKTIFLVFMFLILSVVMVNLFAKSASAADKEAKLESGCYYRDGDLFKYVSIKKDFCKKGIYTSSSTGGIVWLDLDKKQFEIIYGDVDKNTTYCLNDYSGEPRFGDASKRTCSGEKSDNVVSFTLNKDGKTLEYSIGGNKKGEGGDIKGETDTNGSKKYLTQKACNAAGYDWVGAMPPGGKYTSPESGKDYSNNTSSYLNAYCNESTKINKNQAKCISDYFAWVPGIKPGEWVVVNGKTYTNQSSTYQDGYCDSENKTGTDPTDMGAVKKEDDKKGGDISTKCALSNGVGFIICPLMWMMSAAIDSTYGLLSNILAIPSTIFSNVSVLAAFHTFLPYANLVLAVVFLLIIYSEATGNGFGAMNNYSIKKTLPRLIIFAILINLSFYICAAAVDVSNIAGSSMYKLFTGTSSDFSKQLNKDNNFTTQAEKATGNENYGKDK